MATTTFPQRWRVAGAALPLGLAALVLTACGATTQSLTEGDDAGAASVERADSAQTDEGALAEEEPQGEGGGGALGADVEAADRDLIHTATMSVRVSDVPEAAELAKELTIEAGGYVASEQLRTPAGRVPTAQLALRIPNDGYEDALADLAELGDRSDLERSVDDVTDEVADVESRIETAQTSLETLRGYLEEAEDVDDLLRIEQEIQTRQSELESYQARLETLTNQTTYSTVHLSLDTPDTYVEAPSGDAVGFLEALRQGWGALVAVTLWIAVIAGWALPFLAVAAVVGVPVWWYLRKRTRRTRGDSARDADRSAPVAAAVGGGPEAGGDGGTDSDDSGSGPGNEDGSEGAPGRDG
ncbi:DUF4349 domain-containing protein [Nocardiopsis sp. EMB25]|uniref:DUF4349 domain-containing protein n=1 Tax=Nocardiopsis sp. EMB25 TaxID=2835867 RepID=UPI002283DD4E|nr:DUF4349 domain-containing protein [Nocardiopsis sp. EMB25]MCY9784454.1 DUF4349 domain-containing protein [Nocardiopsis sp. EMB25]